MFTVAYLDDEIDLLEMFVDLFSAPDLHILTFSDPQEAVSTLSAHPPDLLFLDYRLPHTTGDLVAQALPAEIPKVLVTGDLQVKLQSSFLDIFAKPWDVPKMEDFIRERKQKRVYES